MNPAFAEKDRVRLRRISRARIFDGHPLKPDVYAVAVMVVIYVFITSSISILFSYLYEADYFLIIWSLLPGVLLGLALLVLERSLVQLKNYMFPQIGKLLTAFLLFFVHMIGYLAFSSIMLNYPVGIIMGNTADMAGLAGKYSLFSVNFFIVLALLSWLRNVRSSLNPCF